MPRVKKEIDFNGLYQKLMDVKIGSKESDQLVAEYFGYKQNPQGKWKAPHKELPTRPAIPHFTTDTDTALLLFKLFLKEYSVNVHEDFSEGNAVTITVAHWTVPRHTMHPGVSGVYKVSAPSRQLAICLAAMKAHYNHAKVAAKNAA